MKAKTAASAARFAYEGLDRVMHERARLSLLTSLLTHPQGLTFVELKRFCDLTDGNLARHLQVLEEEKLVSIIKDHGEGRAQTLCKVTASGRKRFLEYLRVLETVVRDATQTISPASGAIPLRKLKPADA